MVKPMRIEEIATRLNGTVQWKSGGNDIRDGNEWICDQEDPERGKHHFT